MGESWLTGSEGYCQLGSKPSESSLAGGTSNLVQKLAVQVNEIHADPARRNRRSSRLFSGVPDDCRGRSFGRRMVAAEGHLPAICRPAIIHRNSEMSQMVWLDDRMTN